jgi:membrane protease subunit HflC
VRYFDMRILTFDDAEPLRFITSEKKPVLVDSFVKWRISDVASTTSACRATSSARQTRIKQTISDGLQPSSAGAACTTWLSGQRDDIMADVRTKADVDLKRIGVEIVDVRLKRVDLPQEVSDSVFGRMQAERKRIANEQRSTGAAEAERIRADAERQREIILAEAYRDAQRTRGEGDAKSSAIYAGAFKRQPRVLFVLPQHGGRTAPACAARTTCCCSSRRPISSVT